MSDVLSPDEGGPEFDALAPTDLRSRLEDACRAAGVSPLAVIGSAVLVLGVAVVVLVFAGVFDGDDAPVEASLPFTRPAEQVTATTTGEMTDDRPDEVVVHVAGAVAQPGVYRLEPDARVVDAIDAAGGTDDTADPARVNLAAPLTDGQQIYVVAIGEPVPVGPATAPVPPDEVGSALVDLNRATASELEALPGIGPALAAAIVSHRDEHGPFVAVESLLDVSGIGEVKLAGLRDFATV